MEININEIDTSKLDLKGNYLAVSFFLEKELERGESINDYMLSWIIDAPQIWASTSVDDEFLEKVREKAEQHSRDKPKNLKIVKQLKKEFYDFMCTESEYYAKERAAIGGNINTLIVSLAGIFATKVKGVEVGIATSFVTTFMIIVGKMGKRAMCESFKPKE